MIQDIKLKAKGKIREKIIFLFLIGLIPGFISSLVTPVFPLAILLVLLFNFGVSNVFLKVLNNQSADYKDITIGFSSNNIQRYLFIGLNMVLRVFLYTLLLIIPGVIKAYELALVNYLAVERPELNYREVLAESTRLMNGHKLNLFMLQISFLGWWFLVVITFGLAGIYVIPYYQMARAQFYHEVKAK
jgi:uncharacterized membrane protein